MLCYSRTVQETLSIIVCVSGPEDHVGRLFFRRDADDGRMNAETVQLFVDRGVSYGEVIVALLSAQCWQDGDLEVFRDVVPGLFELETVEHLHTVVYGWARDAADREQRHTWWMDSDARVILFAS